MKNFIEVTTTNRNNFTTRVFVNINNISHVIKTDEHRCNIIYVGGTDDNYSMVLQPYEEVKQLIEAAI